jgi:NAD(P)-dependent dehydrogenase (short-subunit alcohol dehydrogenase family)
MSIYSGKNVVITGGGSGIGFALAKLLADGGARVVITGRSQDRLDAATRELGSAVSGVRGDVASLADLDALAERVKGELAGVDGLFVNAGISPVTPFETITEAAYDEVFAVDTKGAYFTVQKLAPLLNPGAGVVFTTSVANVIGMRDTSVYAAAKAAVRSMARSLSRELLPRDVRVNAVRCGPVDTGILDSMMGKEAADAFKAERVAENPMRRFGTPEEVARAMAFLAFEATYTTGVEFAVDGGVTQL